MGPRTLPLLFALLAALATATAAPNSFAMALAGTIFGLQSDPPPIPAGRVYPPGTAAGCQPEQLVCQNGYFNQSKCLEWEQWNWPNSYDNCTCDPGWYGTDCSIPSKAVCDNMTITNVTNYIFDTSFVNLNSTRKHLECFVTDTTITQFLADHRVNVTVSDGGRAMNFTMYTRVWNESRSKHIYSFSPQVTIMNCWGSKCQSYRSGDPNAQAVYECEDISCTSCDADQGCSLLFVLSVDGIHGFKANFYNVDEVHGTADCKFIADNGFSFTLSCRTGQCTNLTPSSNYVPYHSTFWIVVVILTLTAFSVAALLLLAIRSNVSNRPQFKLDASRRALGETAYQPLIDGDQAAAAADPAADAEADKVRKANIQLVFDHVNYDIEVSAAPASEVVPLGADPARGQQPISGLALYWQGLRACWHAMGLDRMCCGPTRKRRVLDEVTGLVRSGEILAILGLSGAGKTTLLDILARRPKIGRVTGTVTLFRDGNPVKPRRTRLADFASYVPSDDCLLPTMTVFETVLFSARLRLGRSWSDERIFEKVERVLADLGLTHVADSRVGSYDRGGISTGERKRVCIAMELVADPLVLLLDEPTSGLDSYNASLLMEVISKLAKTRGLLCVCSIHQPPSSVFSLFDRLLLLTRQGRVAYSGPAQQVMQYMASHAGHPCKDPWVNPAEFLLALASNTNHATVAALATSFADSQHARDVESEVAAVYAGQNGGNGGYSPIRTPFKSRAANETSDMKEPSAETHKAPAASEAEEMLVPVSEPNSDDKILSSQYYAVEDDTVAARAEEPRASFFMQIRLVSARAFVHLARNPGLLFLHLVFTVLFGVGMGVIYLQLDNGIAGVLDRVGFLFFVIYFFALTSLSSLPHFTQDRVLFVRERADRYYSTLPYAISKILCDLLPLRVLPPVIFSCISYYMVGLQDDPYRFFVFVVLMVMVNVHAASVCFCISSFCTSLASANLLAAMWFIFWMLFGGFFVNMGGGSETISIVASLRYGSFFFYAFDALMLNEFMDLDVFWNAKNYPSIHIGGITILENLSLENRSLGFNVGILLAMSFTWYFVGFMFLLLFQRTKR